MKRMLLIAIALTLCAQGAADAEPDMIVGSTAVIMPSMDAVYLLAEPSASAERLCEIPAGTKVTILAEVDALFTRVNDRGQKGYVPSAALDYAVSLGGLSIRERITDSQRENLARFLTAFTETRFADLSQGAFDLTAGSDALLAEFAARRIQLDDPDVEMGEYADDMNARLPDEVILTVVERYFGITPESFDHADGFYCWYMEDDPIRGGFTVLTNIIDLENGDYELYFNIYGVGADWSDEVFAYSESDAADAFPDPIQTGRAVIHADSLDDPESFTLLFLVVSE